jgi:hypothetical protein
MLPMPRKLLLSSVLLLLLAGCRGNVAGQSAESTFEPTLSLATATPFALAATLSPDTPVPSSATPESTRAVPTALPEPTLIVDASPTAGAGTSVPGPVTGSGEPSIVISPQLGAPRDIVVVTGSGWPANATVSLHWGAPDGPTGPLYWEVETDERGFFEIGLIVLPADRWPGGPPEDRDVLQLRALSPALGDYYYFANFTYIPPLDPVYSLVQTFTNEEYDYQISVPNLWTWSWIEDDVTDVRFQSPTEIGYGFVLVYTGTDPAAIIPTVMAREAAGLEYTTGPTSVGAYPGTEAVTSTGMVLQFIPANGYIFVLSFVNDNNEPAYNILSSLALTE